MIKVGNPSEIARWPSVETRPRRELMSRLGILSEWESLIRLPLLVLMFEINFFERIYIFDDFVVSKIG